MIFKCAFFSRLLIYVLFYHFIFSFVENVLKSLMYKTMLWRNTHFYDWFADNDRLLKINKCYIFSISVFFCNIKLPYWRFLVLKGYTCIDGQFPLHQNCSDWVYNFFCLFFWFSFPFLDIRGKTYFSARGGAFALPKILRAFPTRIFILHN